MGFRLFIFVPPPPLPIYLGPWRWIQGLLDMVSLFPAVVMSGLLIPFGFPVNSWKGIDRFSSQFWEKIKSLIITAIVVNVLYGLLFFLVFPLARDYEDYLNYQGYLFNTAKKKAQESAEKEAWADVVQLIAICDQIWTNSPEINSLRDEAGIGLEELRFSQAEAIQESLREYTESYGNVHVYAGYSDRGPVSADDALVLADKALNEERCYDAYWLANLGIRLAKRNSAEFAQFMTIINKAKLSMGLYEPTAREVHAYTLYRKKRDARDALRAEDWIKAYYLLKNLTSELPGDIDVSRFLALSEEGCKKIAFFY
jgi:hypothetical protein